MTESVYENKYTFWRLLSEFKIEIPIIQRDYAQGRVSYNVTAIRDELLDSIYNALVNDKPINFDFVYGTIEDNKLFPLDGQQRLTTFYLLHWYLAEKEHRMDEASSILSNFSYTTRVSSREFCELLSRLDYVPEKDTLVSEYISNENGFYKSWNSDPTIKHMLVMLDAIHNKFFDTNNLFDSLISEEKSILTFNYLPMEHYALTDELYIKMNARGKALSSFENFKAKFIQHLRDNNLPYKYFEECIDLKWTDLLWEYRSYDNTMDDAFINLFCYLTEMQYLENADFDKKEGDSPFSVKRIRELITFYDTEEKVLNLYSYLDLWKDRKEIDGFANEYFSNSFEEGKVKIFDGDYEIMSCIIEGVNVPLPNKILLFSAMKRMVMMGKKDSKEDLLDYIRIIRNYLLNTRSFISKKCTFTSDFRFARHGIPFVQNFVNVLCESKNPYRVLETKKFENVNFEIIERERNKASIILKNPNLKSIIQRLEDLDVFKSVVFNVLPYVVENNDKDLVNNLDLLFKSKNLDILRAMLSISNYGICITDSSLYGPKYYYGDIDNWYNIFTYDGGKQHTEFICSFISQFENTKSNDLEKSLKEIIKNNLKDISKNDWRYALIKYESTLENDAAYIDRPYYIFALEECENGIILPHRINGYMLNGYHMIPDYLEIVNQLSDICCDNILGFASETSGEVKINCSCNVRFIFDGSGDWAVLYESNVLSKRVAKVLEQYNSLKLSKKDRVEQGVIMAQLLFEEFGKKKK